ncbi:MAG: fatty acid desaturase CarF family protein [Novipirellula sp. JB048]
MKLTWIIVNVAIAWLFADFLTGAVHWIEDRYTAGDHSLDFVNSIASDNQLHHDKPTAMLLNTQWENIRSSAIVAWPIGIVLAVSGFPLWFWAGIMFTSIGNLIHRWAHTPRRQLPRWIRGMQEFGIFLSPENHDLHHRKHGQLVTKAEAERNYCPMTDFVNPALDACRFWQGLELMLRLVGIKTVDLSKKPE